VPDDGGGGCPDDVWTTRRLRCGRRQNPGPNAHCGQEPLERCGRGAADAGGPRTPRHGRHAVPQEVAGGQLHGSGHVASDAVWRQRVLGLGDGRRIGAQHSSVFVGSSQGHVPVRVRARRVLARSRNERVRIGALIVFI